MPQPIELPGGRKIGHGEPCFIVAEIGQNHNGSIDAAQRLIDVAAEAGCDAVKMCKRDINSDLTLDARTAPYTGHHSYGQTYGEHRAALELPVSSYSNLHVWASRGQMRFFSTVCDIKSADEIREHIDPPLYKIASRDIDNLPLIEYVAKFGKPVILSGGMAGNEDVEAAVTLVQKHGSQVIMLLCCSEYPAPDDGVACLHLIRRMAERDGIMYGLSDHTIGIHIPQAAACFGAVMIEKHITLARAGKGTDHACSLEPDGLRRMVRNIRAVEAAKRGDRSDEATAAFNKLGRSLASTCHIAAGTKIHADDVCLKSPGHGVHWPDRERVVGHVAKVEIPADTTILLSQVED